MLLLLVALNGLKGRFTPLENDKGNLDEKIFIQISGDIECPGVYGFAESPDLESLLLRAGGFPYAKDKARPTECVSYGSGMHLKVKGRERGQSITQSEMSAFYKTTLEIPLSLNSETSEGLTAIPGIGQGLADAIVTERTRKGGFQSLDDLLAIEGIGPKIYGRIRPYLVF